MYSDPETNEPFYIGKGKNKRIFEHLQAHSLKKNTWKNNKIKKILNKGLNPKITKLKENLSEEEALQLEYEIIKKMGRLCDKTGPLTNISPGGEKTDNLSGRKCYNDGTKNYFLYENDEETQYLKQGRLWGDELNNLKSLAKKRAEKAFKGKVACKNIQGDNIFVEKEEYAKYKGTLYFPVAIKNSEETKKKKSLAMKDKPKSDSHKEALREAGRQQHRIHVSCLCCHKNWDIGNYTRHITKKENV